MARPLRIEFPGALYHVVARGNERKPIYRADQDRGLFLATLERACVKDIGRSTEFPFAQRRPNIAALDHLLTTRTDAAISNAYRNGYRIREIAAALSLHYSTVSRRITSFERSPAQKELLQRKT